MNALRAVPADGNDDAATGDLARADLARADLAPVDGDYDDSAAGYDPALDPEALLLCALMWSYRGELTSTEVARITTTLTADDFDDPAHRRLFTVIAQLVADGTPHDGASVTGALIRSGAEGDKDGPLRKRLLGIVTAGADGLTATHYADLVISQAYRRSFHTAGTAITAAAQELPEEDLFEHMLEYGRRQRAALNRLNTFRAARADSDGKDA